MNREIRVQFVEGVGVRFPGATQLCRSGRTGNWTRMTALAENCLRDTAIERL
jgi:hypothetical protein